MNCNSNGIYGFGGANWWWILILILIICYGSGNSGCCDNGCGCC